MNAGARIVVGGVVQGVGFRWFVVRRARQRGLTGFVRNLQSEEVEVECEGDRHLLCDFIEELKIGPPAASVGYVRVIWQSYIGKYTHFTVALS